MKALRKADVMFKDALAGVMEETGTGCRFAYDPVFLKEGKPIAVAFPLREQPYESATLFPFFKGLLPEGKLAILAASGLGFSWVASVLRC